jgi:hypothetical protein
MPKLSILKKYLIYITLFGLVIFIIRHYLHKKVYEYESFESNPRTIYLFWTGSNPLTDNRQKAIESIRAKSGCDVKLITIHNLDSYILKDHPLHPAYEYLSEVHKSDYLRTYFMHFYGGGYSDVKQVGGDWNKAFEDMEHNPNAYANGYPEIGPHGVGYAPYAQYWKDLIGNCAYIFRPRTPFTEEWYSEMMTLLDSKLDELKQHPASHPRDKKEDNTGYPIGWIEMLGEIFHKIGYKYKDNILMTVPPPIFSNYM